MPQVATPQAASQTNPQSSAPGQGTLVDLLNRKKGGEVVTVAPECSVAVAVRTMCQQKVGSVIIVEHEHPVGVFTERDVMHRLVAPGRHPETTKVSEVMTSPFASGPPEMSIREAAELMSQNRIRHLPICVQGQLLGLISSGDVLAWKLEEQELSLRHLENYCFRH